MNPSLFPSGIVTSKRILYTPSSFAKKSLLYIQEIGKLDAEKPHISQRQDLSSYLFFIVLRGSGTLEYNGVQHALTMGDCVFINCKVGYSHSTSKDLWTLKWVHFFGPNIHNIHEKYIERGGSPVFHSIFPERFEHIWSKLYSLANSSDYIRDMRINEHLTSLLTLLMEHSWNPETGNRTGVKRQNLGQIKSHLDANFTDKITLDDLAKNFFINKYYLSHGFKEQYGLTISDYLLSLRITHAKQLLRFSDLTAASISAACGMTDPNYFSRIFKKVEGISPTAYRRFWRTTE